jgi:hypothetical protein
MATKLQSQEEWVLSFIETVCQANNYDFATFASAWQESIVTSQNPIHKTPITKPKAKPDKPKRDSSAYVFFCQDNRPTAKTNLPPVSRPAEVMKELGRMWSALKNDASRAEELAGYHAKAADDKKRVVYETGIDPINSAVVGETQPKPVNVRKKFVKRVTGYDMYCRENKLSIQEQNPKLNTGEVTKTMAKAWKAMETWEKQKWKDLAMLE